jgi:hypothetical protein
MAIQEPKIKDQPVDIYNYKSFTRSESAGKAVAFMNSLRVGEEAPDFEMPTLEGTLSAPWPETRLIGIREHHLTAVRGRGLAPQQTLQKLSG